MPVDVMVDVGLPEGAEVADAYSVREALERDLSAARVDGITLNRTREVSGGTQFEPLVADATYEATNTRDAMVTVGLIAASLLKQGFVVRTRGALTVTGREEFSAPEPGEAVVQIVAPLGTS